MKLTTFFLIAGMMHVMASGYSQSVNVVFTKPIMTLGEALATVEKTTEFKFFYRNDQVNLDRAVSVDGKYTQLPELLAAIFNNMDIEYKVVENNLIILTQASQQKKAVSGKILNSQGNPLPGVTIAVKGTSRGTVTDANGNYTIQLGINEKVLVFSSVGMKKQELEVGNRTTLDVTMVNENPLLDEIVVIGYGTTTRKDLTGSVSSIKTNEIKNLPSLSVDDAMAGKAAGVQIIKSDGSPGGGVRMRIRGGTSLIGGNDPLYIIDGVQVTPQNKYIQNAAEIINPVEWGGYASNIGAVSGAFARGLNNLGGLNINDIESIDILKDASATAIYGSKAANGVVIITTKKGKTDQKPTLEANYYSSLSTPINEKRLDRDQYIMILKEGAKNLNDARAALNLTPNTTATAILNDPNYFGTANTDWLKLVTRTGIAHNADISVRGGGKGSRYYTSLSYTGQTGVLKGTDFSRISGKISLDNEITSRIRVITNMDYGFTKNNITNGIYSNAQFVPPTFSPYNADGTINRFTGSVLGQYTDIQNPLALLKGINEAKTASVLGTLALEYDILKDLRFKSMASVNYSGYHQLNYAPSVANVNSDSGPTSSQGGIGSQGQTEQADMFFENTLTWDKQFNDNNRINVLAGTSWQQSTSKSFSASGQGYPDDEFLNELNSAAVALMPSASTQQYGLLSFYVRANYALKERYLLTFTGRSDASSKFPKSNRVGYFPSGGIAWRISEEGFMKGIKWLNELKLRASAGYTGTQNIGNNMFYTLYSPVSYAGTNGLIPTQLGNDKIKWESTLQKDLGIDFAMFNSRLRGTFGYYEKNTTGILLATSIPISSGFTSVLENKANIQNKGLELDLRGEFITTKDFQWSGSFNISGNRSKVLKIERDLDNPDVVSTYANDPYYNSVFLGNSIIREGQPIGQLYGYKFTGLIKTADQLAWYKEHNALTRYAAYGIMQYLGIGDAMFQVIDTGIYKGQPAPGIIGHAEPKFFGGYTNTFSYKGFTLTALFTYSYGGDIHYLADLQNLDVSDQTNKGVRILGRYTPTNTNTDRPRLILGEMAAFGANPNSYAIHDGSYIKLKSVTLNWQLPAILLKKLNIQNANVYFAATNLFTITHYPGADPEISDDPYSLIGGYSDAGNYPTIKQYSVGLRLDF